MGTSIGENGVHSMECQSCHGSILDVGDEARTGWRDVPSCASCHTGSAMKNNGLLRYKDVHEADGSIRHPVDNTFAECQ
jgi:hypothetical protein